MAGIFVAYLAVLLVIGAASERVPGFGPGLASSGSLVRQTRISLMVL
jgi:hypothetical protein